MLRRAGARAGAVYAAGAVPGMAYGAEMYGIPDTLVRKIRVERLKLDGRYLHGGRGK